MKQLVELLPEERHTALIEAVEFAKDNGWLRGTDTWELAVQASELRARR